MKRNEAIELLSKMLDDKVFPRSDYRQVKWLKNNIWNNKESKIRINKYLHLTKIASSHENQKHSFSIASYFFSVMWIVICASEWKYWKHQIESSWSSPWGKENFFRCKPLQELQIVLLFYEYFYWNNPWIMLRTVFNDSCGYI